MQQQFRLIRTGSRGRHFPTRGSSLQFSRKPESTPPTRLAFHAGIPLHQPCQASGDRQAQAGTTVFAGRRGIDLLELLEQLPDLVLIDPDARVGNLKPDPEQPLAFR